jgi:hypothetical protein
MVEWLVTQRPSNGLSERISIFVVSIGPVLSVTLYFNSLLHMLTILDRYYSSLSYIAIPCFDYVVILFHHCRGSLPESVVLADL